MSNAFSFEFRHDASFGNAKPPETDGEAASSSFQKTATRADLLDAVAVTCAGMARPQMRDIFEMMLDEVSETLSRGESVKLRSFGMFNVREKRERIGRNPRTGVEVAIKPRRVLTFKPSSVLLDAVQGNAGKSSSRTET